METNFYYFNFYFQLEIFPEKATLVFFLVLPIDILYVLYEYMLLSITYDIFFLGTILNAAVN